VRRKRPPGSGAGGPWADHTGCKVAPRSATLSPSGPGSGPDPQAVFITGLDPRTAKSTPASLYFQVEFARDEQRPAEAGVGAASRVRRSRARKGVSWDQEFHEGTQPGDSGGMGRGRGEWHQLECWRHDLTCPARGSAVWSRASPANQPALEKCCIMRNIEGTLGQGKVGGNVSPYPMGRGRRVVRDPSSVNLPPHQ